RPLVCARRELAVLVLVDQRDLNLAGERIEAPFDLDLGVPAVLGDGAHDLLDPDMRMRHGQCRRQQRDQGKRQGDDGLHAVATGDSACGTGRGLPSSSIATNTKVPCVTRRSTLSWRRRTTVSSAMVIEVRPTLETSPQIRHPPPPLSGAAPVPG